jgi:hypothetical protein
MFSNTWKSVIASNAGPTLTKEDSEAQYTSSPRARAERAAAEAGSMPTYS